MPYCTSCGTEVAAGAATCPSCGHPQGQAFGAPSYAVAPRTDGQAITSLVLGIVGLIMCPLIPSIIAVIIGNQARQRLAADPSLQGEELARVGVILGWIGIGLSALGAVAFVLFFFVSVGMSV